MLIAACSSSGSSPGGSTNPSATGAAGDPVKGGDLVFASSMDIATLDPAFSQNFNERFAYYAIYNTLVGYDAEFNLVPELAESWETSQDGKTLTFKLREGVKFHDGTDFNAEAAKWNLDRLLDESVNSPLRGSITPPLQSVRAVDETTLELSLERGWRPLVAAMGERPGFMVSPTAVEKFGKDFGANPVGTGPFKFVSYVQDSELKLERFADYWDPDNVHLDSITFKNTPEQQVQLTMLRTGEAHIADALTPQLASTVAGDSAVTVLESETGNWWALQMDVDKPPFDKAELRQAIAHATNREGVQSAIFRDKARLATGPIGIGWSFADDGADPVYPFDLDKAKQLVEQAGATGTTVDYINSSDSDYQAIAQLLQDGYSKIGLNLQVDTVPGSDYYDLVVEDQLNWTLTSWTPRADPDGLLRLLFHTDGSQNTTGYSNPKVDELLDQAAGIQDTDEAAPIYQEVQDILEEDAPYVWVIWPNTMVPQNSKVGGLTLRPDSIYRLRELWISS
jgi:peptide/nickel transport system substrate-binding protein